jgi:hypothetical protein
MISFRDRRKTILSLEKTHKIPLLEGLEMIAFSKPYIRLSS